MSRRRKQVRCRVVDQAVATAAPYVPRLNAPARPRECPDEPTQEQIDEAMAMMPLLPTLNDMRLMIRHVLSGTGAVVRHVDGEGKPALLIPPELGHALIACERDPERMSAAMEPYRYLVYPSEGATDEPTAHDAPTGA